MRNRTRVVAATGIALLLLGALLWSFFVGAPVPAISASSPDMSIEEAGELAGPRFASSRQQHLSNRDEYNRLSFVQISSRSQLSQQLAGPIRSTLRQSTDLPRDPELAEKLGRSLAWVLWRASRLDDAEYVESLPRSGRWVVPSNAAMIRGLYAGHLGRAAPDLTSADPEIARKVFADLSALARAHNEGATLPVAWSTDRVASGSLSNG